MSRNCLVSVATYSYLPKACVMADTFAKHNWGCEILLLVPDMSQAQIDSKKWPVGSSTRVLGLDALGDPLIGAMHKYFDAFELCCALKSLLLQHVLFVEGYDKAVALDPDTMCYAPFDEVWSALENSDIALTPHTNSPMPEDGEVPDDLEFVSAGFINGGFMAARKSQSTEICIDWMIKKVSDLGFFAPQFNVYADQTWMSCLPWYFPESVSIIRHAGMNVAYWNLHERKLISKNEDYFCNDQRLIFFHYSGFDSKRRTQLTKHSRRAFCPETNATLSNLLGDYDARLTRIGAQIPQLAPDFPCSRLSLKKRLKIFKLLRGKAARLSSCKNSLVGRFFNLAHSIIRGSRKFIKT